MADENLACSFSRCHSIVALIHLGGGSGKQGLASGQNLVQQSYCLSNSFARIYWLHYLQQFVIADRTISTANFRLLLILSTQLTAVFLIAIDSHFNLKALFGGLFVVIGAVIGALPLNNYF